MPTRREFVQHSVALGGAIAGLGAGVSACASSGAAGATAAPGVAGGTMSAVSTSTSAAHAGSAIKQSVCKWCFNDMTVDALAANAKRIGIQSVELIDPTDYPDVTKHGLICAMTNAPGDPRTRIPKGFNREENHSWLIP